MDKTGQTRKHTGVRRRKRIEKCREKEEGYLKDRPGQGVAVEQVGENLGHIPQFVGLEAVDGRVLLFENLLERVLKGEEGKGRERDTPKGGQHAGKKNKVGVGRRREGDPQKELPDKPD